MRAAGVLPHAAAPGTLPAAGQPVIAVPINDSRWANAFADRVVWLVGEQRSAAEIRINPPQLGPIEVRINVSNGETNAVIHAPHATTREAIEQAIPRLREMFAAAGLELGQVDVGAGQLHHPASETHAPLLKAAVLASDDQDLRVVSVNAGPPRGLVDLYA